MPKYTWMEGDREISKEWDLEKHLSELGLDKTKPEEILIVDCPRCGAPSFYNGGFTDSCSCCGYYNLADYSEEAITLLDHWERCWDIPY